MKFIEKKLLILENTGHHLTTYPYTSQVRLPASTFHCASNNTPATISLAFNTMARLS